jgi:hypothetical protein
LKFDFENERVIESPMQNPPLVLIEWEDSHHRSGWTTDNATASPLLCRSVGWLVAETKQAKVLSANITTEENMQRCGDMTIPQRCIRQVTKLLKA